VIASLSQSASANDRWCPRRSGWGKSIAVSGYRGGGWHHLRNDAVPGLWQLGWRRVARCISTYPRGGLPSQYAVRFGTFRGVLVDHSTVEVDRRHVARQPRWKTVRVFGSSTYLVCVNPCRKLGLWRQSRDTSGGPEGNVPTSVGAAHNGTYRRKALRMLETTIFGEMLVKGVLVLTLNLGIERIVRYDRECLWSIHRVRGGWQCQYGQGPSNWSSLLGRWRRSQLVDTAPIVSPPRAEKAGDGQSASPPTASRKGRGKSFGWNSKSVAVVGRA